MMTRVKYAASLLLVGLAITLATLFTVTVVLPARDFTEVPNGGLITVGEKDQILVRTPGRRLGRGASVGMGVSCMAVAADGVHTPIPPPPTAETLDGRYGTVALFPATMKGGTYHVTCDGEWQTLYLNKYHSLGENVVGIGWGIVFPVILVAGAIVLAMHTYITQERDPDTNAI